MVATTFAILLQAGIRQSITRKIHVSKVASFLLQTVAAVRLCTPDMIACVLKWRTSCLLYMNTVYPKKSAHGFVVLCFVVVMQTFIMNSHEVFIHIHQGCFAGTGAIVRLPQCQWSKPDGYGKISQCITTTKHSKAKTVCIFLGITVIARSGRLLHEPTKTYKNNLVKHQLYGAWCFNDQYINKRGLKNRHLIHLV